MSKEPRYVDLDSEVHVQSGINLAPDTENHDEVLRAATMFMKHPARALSVRELSLLMEGDIDDCQGYLDSLEAAGVIHETNELDDGYKRYRLGNG